MRCCIMCTTTGPPYTKYTSLLCITNEIIEDLSTVDLGLSQWKTTSPGVRPYTVRFQYTGHFLVLFARYSENLLLRKSSPSLGNVSGSAPVELFLTLPRLLVLRLGLNSHSHKLGGLPSSAQFAFRRLGDPQHATILSSAAFCCRCLLSVPWC